MSKVFVSPLARQDLQDIRTYITEELGVPAAAANTLGKISKRIHSLAVHPLQGTPLSTIVGIDTEYRFLVCGNYLVFYRAEATGVYVDRVLYGRRDYLTILFGKPSELEN